MHYIIYLYKFIVDNLFVYFNPLKSCIFFLNRRTFNGFDGPYVSLIVPTQKGLLFI